MLYGELNGSPFLAKTCVYNLFTLKPLDKILFVCYNADNVERR